MAIARTVNLLKFACILALAPMTIALSSNQAMAEGSNPGGAEFAQAAIEYRETADRASEAGNVETAEIYTRLAEIKDGAAQLADEGRWDEIDWSEYHELNAVLADISL